METIQTAANDFLMHCRYEKNLTEKTLKAYKTDLAQLVAFLIRSRFSLKVKNISKLEIRKYLASISHLKPKSLKRKIASSKAFFNFLEFEDKIQISPFRKMRITIKEPKSLPKVMDLKEISQILRRAYENKNSIADKSSKAYNKALREIVILELLFATGARVSEIANLRRENINLANGQILIIGKGNRERMIQICNKDVIEILKEYQKQEIIADNSNSFLSNRHHRKISDQSIRNVVKKIALQAGLAKHITPHVFRHSFATLLLEKEVDIKYIQSFLGHSSIVTTQIYTHVNRAKQRQILKAKHPRKDLSIFSYPMKDN